MTADLEQNAVRQELPEEPVAPEPPEDAACHRPAPAAGDQPGTGRARAAPRDRCHASSGLFAAEGVEVCPSLDAALALARLKSQQVFIIGASQASKARFRLAAPRRAL
jgi:hypothetical protein